jgi:hypothetical protein
VGLDPDDSGNCGAGVFVCAIVESDGLGAKLDGITKLAGAQISKFQSEIRNKLEIRIQKRSRSKPVFPLNLSTALVGLALRHMSGLRLQRFASVFTLGVLLVCSCSPGGDPALIGKWKVKDSNHTIEIRKDGNWVEEVEKDAQVTSSTWEWEDTNHIRLTMNSKLVGKASGVMKVTLNGDTLILKDQDGATEYTRVK